MESAPEPAGGNGIKYKNVLVIVADELARAALGCAGHPLVRTPCIDRLAAAGTRFTAAYSNSPICVPARAVMQTGRYVHQTRHWDSAKPYRGSPDSWGHLLRRLGHRAISVGKLHFRDSGDDNGFGDEIVPLHVKSGVGWAPGLLRRPLGDFPAAAELAAETGPGDTAYHRYDRDVRDESCRWLGTHGADGGAPWTLFVSFVSPHYPLIAPRDYYELYPPDRMDAPACYAAHQRPDHPAVREMLRFFNYDDYFDPQSVKVARAAYYGLVSFADRLIGDVLDALERSGAGDETLVILTSDHGEMLGDHGIWTKQVMYEGSVGVPMIMRGPGIPRRHVVATPCSLLDLCPTILARRGDKETEGFLGGLPGAPLTGLAAGADDPSRKVLSEYHDGGSVTGSFMLRSGRWKLVHHVGYAPQLFDLEGDPGETADLGDDRDHAETLAVLAAELRAIVDPEAADTKAFADQAAMIEILGGIEAIGNMEGLAFGYSPPPDPA